jgi:hypothetical protein
MGDRTGWQQHRKVMYSLLLLHPEVFTLLNVFTINFIHQTNL